MASEPSLRDTIHGDLKRYCGETGLRALASQFFRAPGFRYTFVLRLCQHLRGHRYLRMPLALYLSHLGVKFGIDIPIATRIGKGLYIGHYGTIVVHPEAVIGQDCNLSQGVTIGITNRGARRGVPRLGDRVYIGPGAKVIGGVAVGHDAAIGANAVVTKDVPTGGVAVGVPARIVSTRGSTGYIQNPTSG